MTDSTSLLKLYTDGTLSEELADFEFARVDVGTEKEIKFWICNKSEKWKMVLEPVFDIQNESEKVSFVALPDILFPQESREITVNWTPSMNIDGKLAGWVGIIGKLLIGE